MTGPTTTGMPATPVGLPVRSQLRASLAARVLGDGDAAGRVEVRSAGSEPGDQLDPVVVAVLRERGFDTSREFPEPLADDDARAADVVVRMG